MILTAKAKVAGVMGWPVGHSRSPRLHGWWLDQYGIDLDDRSPYDLVLDSTSAPATDLADQIVAQARQTFP